ncbi:MAG: ion transporter [Flavobacteriales bacterium]|nr:ion transporter [Flavobacteriales bacterium]
MSTGDQTKKGLQRDFEPAAENDWRARIHEVIFEADTPAGKRFDIALLWVIVASVVVVMLESVVEIKDKYGSLLQILEWSFTIVFTIEYIARLVSVKKPLRYVFSFFGLVDLLSIIPTFLGLFIQGSGSLLVIRILRLLRVFRVLKLIGFLREARVLGQALRASRRKIAVFLMTVVALVIILGTLMYIIEDAEAGFTSIPRSIYWAVVTLTTVGYGDIAPATALGQFLASVIMILGYSILAVPTGIVSSELARTDLEHTNTRSCNSCSREGHADDAIFCKFCGEKL